MKWFNKNHPNCEMALVRKGIISWIEFRFEDRKKGDNQLVSEQCGDNYEVQTQTEDIELPELLPPHRSTHQEVPQRDEEESIDMVIENQKVDSLTK